MKRLEPFPIQFLNKVVNKLYQVMLALRKAIYQSFFIKPCDSKTVVFVIGCQRSGTTLMQRLFENDINAKVYGERSRLSSGDLYKRLRMNPLPSVSKEIYKSNVPLVVIRPLVETQNALELFAYFKGSKAIFMYRNFKDVASSNINYFGVSNGVNDLRPIFENSSSNWRSEKLSEESRKIVQSHFSENMNPFDAAALFWFARNSLFFTLHLDEHPNVILCRYENLVADPAKVVKGIYDFIDVPFRGLRTVEEVHSKSVGKGNMTKFSPEIENLCTDLLIRLEHVYKTGPLGKYEGVNV